MAALTAATPPLLQRLNLKPHPLPPWLPFHSLSSSIFGARLCFTSLSVCSSSRLHAYGRFASKKPDDVEPPDISSLRSVDVRLIDEEQNMVGIVSKSEAIQRAAASELDLVVLSPDADPPVVKIMDYAKFRYEQQRKKKEQQKRSAGRMDLKEIKMKCNIDIHDYSVRLKAAQRFLQDGDKVKVVVSLKGRGNVVLEKAIQLIRKFQNDLGELATEENNNFARRKREDITERFIYAINVPNKNLLQKTQEAPKNSSAAPNEVSTPV